MTLKYLLFRLCWYSLLGPVYIQKNKFVSDGLVVALTSAPKTCFFASANFLTSLTKKCVFVGHNTFVSQISHKFDNPATWISCTADEFPLFWCRGIVALSGAPIIKKFAFRYTIAKLRSAKCICGTHNTLQARELCRTSARIAFEPMTTVSMSGCEPFLSQIR